MPQFLHCGEMHYKVCSVTDKVHKRCHAHKYVLTVYLLYANWLHHLKLRDLTWLLNSLCPPIRMYLCFASDVFKCRVYLSQSLTSSGFLLKICFVKLERRGIFKTCVMSPGHVCFLCIHSLLLHHGPGKYLIQCTGFSDVFLCKFIAFCTATLLILARCYSFFAESGGLGMKNRLELEEEMENSLNYSKKRPSFWQTSVQRHCD